MNHNIWDFGDTRVARHWGPPDPPNPKYCNSDVDYGVLWIPQFLSAILTNQFPKYGQNSRRAFFQKTNSLEHTR